eukprot:113564-Chlamydomonas_euryale.AAC.2
MIAAGRSVEGTLHLSAGAVMMERAAQGGDDARPVLSLEGEVTGTLPGRCCRLKVRGRGQRQTGALVDALFREAKINAASSTELEWMHRWESSNEQRRWSSGGRQPIKAMRELPCCDLV